MAGATGIGAHGLWSISRGLARGIDSRGDYKRMMDHADMPRQGDRDGRANLSEAALKDFVLWFLRVCLDQVTFMSELFDLDNLSKRLRRYVEQHPTLKTEAARLLEEALFRGEFQRGESTALPACRRGPSYGAFRDIGNWWAHHDLHSLESIFDINYLALHGKPYTPANTPIFLGPVGTLWDYSVDKPIERASSLGDLV